MLRIDSWFFASAVISAVLALQVSTVRAQELDLNKDNSGSYLGPKIDVHIHANNELTGAGMFGMVYLNPLKNESYQGVSSPKEQLAETLARFKRHNIVKAVVTDGAPWSREHPDQVIISGRSDSPDQMRQWHSEGKLQVIGEIAPFYDGKLASDPEVLRLFDLAVELDVPIGFHIFPGGPPGGIYHLGMKEVRARNANPLQLEEVLVSRPNLRIYIMHAGWPYLEDMKALMYAHPQVYVDLGAISWVLPLIEFHTFLRGLVNAGFGERIMFGSDQMVWPETIDIAVSAVNSADFLSLEQKQDIFYDNAARFLRLDN